MNILYRFYFIIFFLIYFKSFLTHLLMNIHWYIPFFLTYYTLLYFFHHIDNIQQFVDLILSFHFLLFLNSNQYLNMANHPCIITRVVIGFCKVIPYTIAWASSLTINFTSFKIAFFSVAFTTESLYAVVYL